MVLLSEVWVHGPCRAGVWAVPGAPTRGHVRSPIIPGGGPHQGKGTPRPARSVFATPPGGRRRRRLPCPRRREHGGRNAGALRTVIAGHRGRIVRSRGRSAGTPWAVFVATRRPVANENGGRIRAHGDRDSGRFDQGASSRDRRAQIEPRWRYVGHSGARDRNPGRSPGDRGRAAGCVSERQHNTM